MLLGYVWLCKKFCKALAKIVDVFESNELEYTFSFGYDCCRVATLLGLFI